MEAPRADCARRGTAGLALRAVRRSMAPATSLHHGLARWYVALTRQQPAPAPELESRRARPFEAFNPCATKNWARTTENAWILATMTWMMTTRLRGRVATFANLLGVALLVACEGHSPPPRPCSPERDTQNVAPSQHSVATARRERPRTTSDARLLGLVVEPVVLTSGETALRFRLRNVQETRAIQPSSGCPSKSPTKQANRCWTTADGRVDRAPGPCTSSLNRFKRSRS